MTPDKNPSVEVARIIARRIMLKRALKAACNKVKSEDGAQ